MSVNIKTPEEIEKMRVAGRLAAEVVTFGRTCGSMRFATTTW